MREHHYHNEIGALLYAVRKTSFGFRYFHPSPEGPWIKGRGPDPVLYRLPHILNSDPRLPIWVCEGERDADTMATFGHVATTVPSQSWKLDVSSLAGRTVYIVCDNDRGGWKRAQASRTAIEAAGARFDGVFRPPNEFKDVTELVEAGLNPDDRLIEVDLETEQPPFENWRRRNESPVDRGAYAKDGNAMSVRLPIGVLLHHVQAGRLETDDIAAYNLLEDRAGQSSLAKLTAADIANVLNWRQPRQASPVCQAEVRHR